MPLPSSGTITLTQIQTEFGGSAPTNLTEYYRGGAYVTSNNTNVPTSGAISLTNFYGATGQFAFTISSNQVNANLRALAVSAGWDQSAPVVATVASNVYISSNSTGTPALTVNGSFPAGVQLVNNGGIIGMGGAGAIRGISTRDGAPGGTAIAASVAISITNNGSVAGGGGGGGAGAVGGYFGGFEFFEQYPEGGGGGGGGRCGANINSAGGVGGSSWNGAVGAPGGVGSIASAGAGGAGVSGVYGTGGTGGAGGDVGTAGAPGGAASGGNHVFEAAGNGGAAGAAASGNAYITWLVIGTRLGPLT